MTRLTFGIHLCIFICSQYGTQAKRTGFQQQYPLATQAKQNCLYMDDSLVGTDSANDAIFLREGLQHHFSLGGFTLRKWRTSDTTIEESIPAHLRDQEPTQLIKCTEVLTRVLVVEWNATTDVFRPLVPVNHEPGRLIKLKLLSEVSKLFDGLVWCTPAIIVTKLHLER